MTKEEMINEIRQRLSELDNGEDNENIKASEQESILDKIRAKIRKKMKFNCFNESYVLYDDISKIFDKYRTESEPQELEQEPKWIPVSERLPEDDDYRPCTNHEWNDKAVLYYTDKGIIGLGWYYYSTKCWANLDDRWFERDGQVIAWMPLPEPYKAESEDKE